MLVAEEGVPHEELLLVETEHEAMAASEEQEAVAVVHREGEAGLRDAIGSLHDRLEVGVAIIIFDEAA